jgi:hypothetical protein
MDMYDFWKQCYQDMDLVCKPVIYGHVWLLKAVLPSMDLVCGLKIYGHVFWKQLLPSVDLACGPVIYGNVFLKAFAWFAVFQNISVTSVGSYLKIIIFISLTKNNVYVVFHTVGLNKVISGRHPGQGTVSWTQNLVYLNYTKVRQFIQTNHIIFKFWVTCLPC